MLAARAVEPVGHPRVEVGAGHRARRGEQLLAAAHDDAHGGIATEEHRQPGHGRGDHVGQLVGRPQLGRQRGRGGPALACLVLGGDVAHRGQQPGGPPTPTLHRAHPHRAHHPASVAVPQGDLERAGGVGRGDGEVDGIRKAGIREAVGRGVPRVGPRDRRVGGIPAEQAREPVVDLEHGAVEVEDEQGVVQAVGDRPAPRGILAARRGPLEVARDPRPQLEHRERLDQVVVGPGAQGRAGLVLTGPRRQQHDGDAGQGRILPDRVDQAVAVELGHHHVGEHEVGRVAPHGIQRRLPVGHQLDVVVVAQHLGEVAAQVGVVLGHHDPRPVGRPRAHAPRVAEPGRRRRLMPGLHLAQEVVDAPGRHGRGDARLVGTRRDRGRPGRKPDRERAAVPHLAGDGDLAPHQLGELLHHRQADAGPLVGARAGAARGAARSARRRGRRHRGGCRPRCR